MKPVEVIIASGIHRGEPYLLPILLDTVDYEWARHLSYFVTHDTRSIGYACRKRRVGEDWPSALVWLHKEVLTRAVGPPPTPEHTIGDHINGRRLDCRRDNLRWATPAMNNQNRHGKAWRVLTLPFEGIEL